jgi:hypothetical protein
MNALPLLTTVATDAIRRQFAAPPAPAREPERLRTAPSRWRVTLAEALERAADGVAPARYRPAH